MFNLDKIVRIATVAVQTLAAAANLAEIARFVKKTVNQARDSRLAQEKPAGKFYTEHRMDVVNAIKALIMALPLLIPLIEAKGASVIAVVLGFVRGFVDEMSKEYSYESYSV